VSLDETLRQIVREELARAIAELRSLLVQPPSAEWVEIRRCGIAYQTARRLVRARVIAASRVGRVLMVRAEDVRSYIESRRVGVREAGGDEVDAAIARKQLRLLGGQR
jgi:hypothetical protein